MGCVNSIPGKQEERKLTKLGPSQSFRENLMWNRNLKKFYERYQIQNTVGEGSLGAISSVEKISTKEKYAMKTIMFNRITKSMIEEFKNEVQILKTLDHPNIIRCMETYQHKRQFIMIMELCTGSDLYERRYTEERAKEILKQICSAISYCHRNNICHRDIKYENILFQDESENSPIKLIDFGLSTKYTRGNLMRRTVGTVYTMAPEVLTGCYTQACDCWSIGVIAFMMLSNTLPFPGKTDEDTIRLIRKGTYILQEKAWLHVSQDAKEFVKRLLIKNPAERWTVEDCLNSSWFQQSSSDTKMDPSNGMRVLESLQRFSTYGKFKRTAFMVLAYNFDQVKLRELRDAFVEMDTEKTGTINFRELSAVVIKAKLMDHSEIKRLFNEIDQDGSGEIHYMEFIAASLEACAFIEEEKLAEAFDRLDSDDTGYITENNLKEILGKDCDAESIQLMIKEADIKGNGKIDYEEFLHVMRQTHEHEIEQTTGIHYEPFRRGSGFIESIEN